MRVSRIPGPNYIYDVECRVYLNEIEVANWIVADDFRRVVETTEGARFGSVRIAMIGGAKIPDGATITIGGKTTAIGALPSAEPMRAEVAKPNIHIPARKRRASK